MGEENDGWSVAKYLLEFERGMDYAPRVRSMLQHARRLAQSEGAFDGSFVGKLAEAEADMLALELTELRLMSCLSLGQSIGAMASLLKLRGSELVQRASELTLEALGPYALADQVRAAWSGNAFDPIGPEDGYAVTARYFYERAISIYGGTSEVQRNILARRALGF